MYVCICNGVTEKDIHKAVERGICSLDQLSAKTSVTKHCGCCTEYACKVIEEAMAQRQVR
ncbi:MAG: (2Fe-2S)-binding protein [Geminocystis sp.]